MMERRTQVVLTPESGGESGPGVGMDGVKGSDESVACAGHGVKADIKGRFVDVRGKSFEV